MLTRFSNRSTARLIGVAALAAALSACSGNPTKQEIGTVTGAVVGGVVGTALTGSTAGTVVGAGAGAYVGNRVGRDLDRVR